MLPTQYLGVDGAAAIGVKEVEGFADLLLLLLGEAACASSFALVTPRGHNCLAVAHVGWIGVGNKTTATITDAGTLQTRRFVGWTVNLVKCAVHTSPLTALTMNAMKAVYPTLLQHM